MFLVGYDVEGVHRYVLEPVRPMDVMGGSLLLKKFAREAGELARRRGGEVVTSAGGRGIFQVSDEATARDLAEELQGLLHRLTAGGARCTAAWMAADGDFAAARSALEAGLRRARFEERLGQPPPTLVPSGTRPDQACLACGREPATITRQVGQETEGIGPRCAARWEAGKGVSPTIGELFGAARDEVPRGAVLAAAYLDGDGLGRRLAAIKEPGELARFSSQLDDALPQALKDAREQLGSLPLVQVAAGGDDLLVFCDARRLLDLLPALWASIASVAGELEITFSTGVVVGEPLLPLRIYFSEAEEALKAAKARGRQAGRPHVGVRGLLAGRRHPMEGDLFGGPLPQEAFDRREAGIPALVAAVADVDPSQRAGLGDDLALESTEEALLAVEYRAVPKSGAARDGAVMRALEAARRVASEFPQAWPEGRRAPELDLLRGALVFASFGG